jgi:hypothetical protein
MRGNIGNMNLGVYGSFFLKWQNVNNILEPMTTHNYEVHVVTKHPGKPAYPGSPDLEKYRQLQDDKKGKVADMAEVDSSGKWNARKCLKSE